METRAAYPDRLLVSLFFLAVSDSLTLNFRQRFMIRNNVDEDQVSKKSREFCLNDSNFVVFLCARKVGQWSAQVEQLDKTMQSKKSKSMASAPRSSSIATEPAVRVAASSSSSSVASAAPPPAPAAAAGGGFRGLFQRLKDTVGGNAVGSAQPAQASPLYDDSVAFMAPAAANAEAETEQARPRRASYDDEGYAAISLVANINNRALFK